MGGSSGGGARDEEHRAGVGGHGVGGHGAVGLVLARPSRLLGVEPFFMELIGGLEETLAPQGLSILLHVVPSREAELDAYRRWAARGTTEAVVLLNLAVEDPRPAALAQLGLPAVVVGDWSGTPTRPAVRSDESAPMREVAAHLLGLGHRRLARVSGPVELRHTRSRTAALVEVCAAAGVEPLLRAGDYTEASGMAATRALLSTVPRPTAVVYDNDLMALGGLQVAEEQGLAVPGDLSIVAWDDSAACRLANPPLSVMGVDVHEYGCLVGESVLDLLAGRPTPERSAPPARWTERASTGPAPP